MRLQVFAVLLLSALSFSQQLPIAPVPSDPHELVSGTIKVLDETDQRATVLGLIERARQNNDLHAPAGHAFDLKVSFEAAGDVARTGKGQMEEIWLEPAKWRWTATFGSYTQTRLMNGAMYDENPSFLPLRLQMVRGTIFWPIHLGPNELLRIAPGTWNGSPVMCVLGSAPWFQASKASGRSWEESEFCIDTKSGLLQTYSIAPGLYAVYDYSTPVRFHTSVFPGTITMYESGKAVLTVYVDSLTDPDQPDPALFKPSQKMLSQATGPIVASGYRFIKAGGASPVAISAIQPVVVHALLNRKGEVEEAEALQTSDATLSSAAVGIVKNAHFAPQQQQGRDLQREAFIDVRFVPKQFAQPGGN